MIEISEKDFEDIINKNDKCLVMFWGSWCPVCKQMPPVLEKLEKELNINVYTANINKNPKLSVKYDIKATPTFYFIKNGNQGNCIFGAQSFEQLKKFIYNY